MKNEKARLLILVMTMTLVINNMAHPVTPKLVESLGYGSPVFGMVFAAMALANLIMSPIWGTLSDQHGRKVFMIMAPIGYAFAQLGFGFSVNALMIVFFRLLAGGIACASFVAGMAYLVDVTTKEDRSKYMAYYTALTGFGASVGYLLGGYLGNEHFRWAFVAQAILSLISAFVIWAVLTESKEHKETAIKSNVFKDFQKYTGTVLPFLLLMVVLTSYMFQGFNIGFSSYMNYELGLDPFEMGIVMAITGIIGLITNFIVFPLLRHHFNDLKLLIASILIMVITLAGATYFDSLDVKVTILIFFFAFLAMYRPLLQSFISKTGERNGEVMGLNNAANGIGMVIGSLYTGFAYDIQIDLAFYSIVVIGIVVYLLLLIGFKKLLPFAR